MRRLFFFWQYLFGRPPWDSGIPAPELVRVLNEQPAGTALDLGCGTGTNVRYLAERGWRVTGLDFIPRAIEKAKRKTRGLEVTLLVGDVTKLESASLPGPYDLALDIGCWHSLVDEGGRGRYAGGLAHWMKPGGLFMLYAFQPGAEVNQWGIPKDEVIANFSPRFTLASYEQGQGRPSAWYYFMRIDDF
ncbi:MAG: class I SAM-dependent methyltransferase [Anaerolineales bacterium]